MKWVGIDFVADKVVVTASTLELARRQARHLDGVRLFWLKVYRHSDGKERARQPSLRELERLAGAPALSSDGSVSPKRRHRDGTDRPAGR